METKESVFTHHVASIPQIYGNKRIILHKKRVQLSQDLFETPIWPPFIVFEHQYGRRDVMSIRSIRGIAQLEQQKSENKPQREKANN